MRLYPSLFGFPGHLGLPTTVSFDIGSYSLYVGMNLPTFPAIKANVWINDFV